MSIDPSMVVGTSEINLQGRGQNDGSLNFAGGKVIGGFLLPWGVSIIRAGQTGNGMTFGFAVQVIE